MDLERTKKVNHITSSVKEIISDSNITELSDFLSSISEVLCQLDTDIAIEVMNNFGEEGKHQAMAIKVNYGY